MINIKNDIKANKYWTDLPIDERVKLLSYFQLWDGFSNNLYEYLPEEFKSILRLKIEKNYPSWL